MALAKSHHIKTGIAFLNLQLQMAITSPHSPARLHLKITNVKDWLLMVHPKRSETVETLQGIQSQLF